MKVLYKLRVISAFSFKILCVLHPLILDCHEPNRFQCDHLFYIAFCREIQVHKRPAFPLPDRTDIHLTVNTPCMSTCFHGYTNPKAFLQLTSVSRGGPEWRYTNKAYGNGTFEMKNIVSLSRHMGSRADTVTVLDKKYDAQIETRAVGERSSLGSGGSQGMIICKEIVLSVERS